MKYFSISILLFFLSCSAPKALFQLSKKYDHAPVDVAFQNKSTNAISYLWDFGDGHHSTDENPEHRYVLSGKYLVSLTAKNKNKSNISTTEIIIDPPHHCLVEMHTTLGTMTIQLYDETPLHRDNFIKLIEESFYDNTIFHRVIKGFMIQGGDPTSKNASPGKRLGNGGPGYTIPAEINTHLTHIKGALAAARMGDNTNPEKASSGSQFYIVQGNPVSAHQLENFELQKGITYSESDKKIMMSEGGSPQLDNEYTVFGRVVKGFDVIDAIANVKTENSDRPSEDVKILSIKIIK